MWGFKWLDGCPSRLSVKGHKCRPPACLPTTSLHVVQWGGYGIGVSLVGLGLSLEFRLDGVGRSNEPCTHTAVFVTWGGFFQARLLDNQEGANTERCVFGNISVRCFLTPASFGTGTVFQLWRYWPMEISPGRCDGHRRLWVYMCHLAKVGRNGRNTRDSKP